MRRIERERTVLEDACRRLREQARAWRQEKQELRQDMMGLKRDQRELKALNHGLIRETERLTQDRTRVADKYWDKYIGIKAALNAVIKMPIAMDPDHPCRHCPMHRRTRLGYASVKY